VSSKIWFLAAACAVIVIAFGLWSIGGNEEAEREAVAVQDRQEARQDPIIQDTIVPAPETQERPRQETARKASPRRPAQETAEAGPATRWDDPQQFGRNHPDSRVELVTIQGVVECMDPCTQTIIVDGITIDVGTGGNFPMYSTFEIGDFVEATYRERPGSANTLASIEILQKKLK